MLDIKSNVKTLKIVSWHILTTQLALKCIFKGGKGKKVISSWMSSSFQIIQPLYLLETKIIISVNILLFLNPRIRIQEAKMLRIQQILSTGKN